jgi:hypothetical protein
MARAVVIVAMLVVVSGTVPALLVTLVAVV